MAGFFELAARTLGLPAGPMSFPPRDYQGARFFKGTNGRWRTVLDAAFGERMTEHMRTSGLLDEFPA